jgi:hypothetical protein
MNSETKSKFQPKWKEELIGTIDGKQFSIELTMGTLHVYFPTAVKWESSAPIWAKGKWDQVKIDLEDWCRKERIPLTIEENAWVDFEKSE